MKERQAIFTTFAFWALFLFLFGAMAFILMAFK